MDLLALDRELKKGAAELLLLSVLEARPRHGYELGKLIEARSGGRMAFHVDSLSAALSPRGTRLDQGDVGREAGRTPSPLLSADTDRSARAGSTAPDLGRVRRGRAHGHARGTCLIGTAYPPTSGVAAPVVHPRERDHRGALAASRRSVAGADGWWRARGRGDAPRARGFRDKNLARTPPRATATGARPRGHHARSPRRPAAR